VELKFLEMSTTMENLKRPHLPVGTKLSGVKYTITEHLGSGGSSLLYRAKTSDDNSVIIKELFPCAFGLENAFERSPNNAIIPSLYCVDDDGDEVSEEVLVAYLEKSIEKAKQEVEIIQSSSRNASKEEHNPYSLEILNTFEGNGTFYFVVKDDWREPLPLKYSVVDALQYALRILQAIKRFHNATRCLHLDIKPGNMMIGNYEVGSGEAPILLPIDFNSAVRIADIKYMTADKISRTAAYAAPELMKTYAKNFNAAEIGEHTDVYSIGVVLFRFLTLGYNMGDCEFRAIIDKMRSPTLKNGLLSKCGNMAEEIKSEYGREALNNLNTILMKALHPSISFRYQDCGEMISDIEELLGELGLASATDKITAKVLNKLQKNQPALQKLTLRDTPHLTTTCNFIGRGTVLDEIDKHLSDSNYVFLEGESGIGKSELARHYATQGRRDNKKFDIIQFVQFDKNSLKTTIANRLIFVDFPLKEYHGTQEIFDAKMRFLAAHDSRTLVIIDDFNVVSDDDFRLLLNMKCKFIFTTTCNRSNLQKGDTVKVNRMDDENIRALFYANFQRGNQNDPETDEIVKKIIELLEGNTAVIELVAKQLTNSRISPSEMYTKLKNSNLSFKESIPFGKDGCMEDKPLYSHLAGLIDIAGIREDEKKAAIMRCMALVPPTGIDVDYFSTILGLENYECINALIIGGWIKRFYEDKWKGDKREKCEKCEKISLHRIVSLVVYKELKPDYENCYAMLNAYNEIYERAKNTGKINAWKYKPLLAFVCERIKEPPAGLVKIWCGLAFCSNRMKNFRAALKYYQKAAAFFECNGEYSEELYGVHSRLSDVHCALGEFESAFELAHKNRRTIENDKTASPYDVASSYKHISLIYLQKEDMDKALKWAHKALVAVGDNTDDVELLSEVYSIFVRAYHFFSRRIFSTICNLHQCC
jgi:serine/threonine protein kinase